MNDEEVKDQKYFIWLHSLFLLMINNKGKLLEYRAETNYKLQKKFKEIVYNLTMPMIRNEFIFRRLF